MPNLHRFLPPLAILVVLPLSWLASQAPGSIQAVPRQTSAESTPDAPAMSPTPESWIIVDLPPDAPQLAYGAEVYRLVCSACHAYDGTGLTDEWRATWDPDSQNCWQAKCHGEIRPPDGFYLPYSPPIVGAIIPALFETAYDLFEYNYYEMPWHNPKSLTEEEAWAVTAYVLVLNEIDPGTFLNAETATQIRLRPAMLAEETTPTVEPTQAITLSPSAALASGEAFPIGAVAAGVAIVIIIIIGLIFLRRIFS